MTILRQFYDLAYKKLFFSFIESVLFWLRLIPFLITIQSLMMIKAINGTRNNGNLIENQC